MLFDIVVQDKHVNLTSIGIWCELLSSKRLKIH